MKFAARIALMHVHVHEITCVRESTVMLEMQVKENKGSYIM